MKEMRQSHGYFFFGFETSAVGRRMQSRAGHGLTTARD